MCLHLLRLRPTPEQLNAWNKGCSPPNPTHVNQGWTAFLEELAPVSVLDELREAKTEKAEKRKELMQQMYHIAAHEQSYLDGEIGKHDSIPVFGPSNRGGPPQMPTPFSVLKTMK